MCSIVKTLQKTARELINSNYAWTEYSTELFKQKQFLGHRLWLTAHIYSTVIGHNGPRGCAIFKCLDNIAVLGVDESRQRLFAVHGAYRVMEVTETLEVPLHATLFKFQLEAQLLHIYTSRERGEGRGLHQASSCFVANFNVSLNISNA